MQPVDQVWASVVAVVTVAATACEAVMAVAVVVLGVVEDTEVAAMAVEGMAEVVVMAAAAAAVDMVAADQLQLLKSPSHPILSPTMPPMEGSEVRSSLSGT